jgi:phosphohistidine phosphatase SixA
MEIVLVRHCMRADEDSEHLGDRGRHQADRLAGVLERRGSAADAVLTSHSVHARESAELLVQHSAPPLRPVPIDALTPESGPGTLEDVLDQARLAGLDLRARNCVLLVGHEGRLSDLLVELTGHRARPIAHGGAVSVVGATLTDLVSGRGQVHYRFPTVDHQEDELRPKVTSKMAVATFLAGFVFTALSGVLLLPGPQWPAHRIVAVIALTASLSLFISAVYIYDQLATPAGFWTDADRPRRLWQLLYGRRERRLAQRWQRAREAADGDDDHRARVADDVSEIHRAERDGPTYWLMVRTSRLVFTPAVLLALAGFVALLAGTENGWIVVGGLLGLAAGASYSALHRPDLGAD